MLLLFFKVSLFSSYFSSLLLKVYLIGKSVIAEATGVDALIAFTAVQPNGTVWFQNVLVAPNSMLCSLIEER
jgi:hypothetical protein